MKVIICGAGQVGWQIARHLSGEQNSVTIVDSDPDLIRRATENIDVQGVAGFASYPDVLEQAGARDADMIIAATTSDEVNMVVCQIAHSIFSVPRKIARLRSQSYLNAIYSDLYRQDHLPIDVVISPEREVAEAALQRLAAPAAFDSETFLKGDAQFFGIQLTSDCPVLNTPLKQLTDLFSTLRTLVLGIRRKGALFVPTSEDQMFCDDQVYLISQKDDVSRTMEIFGKKTQKQERIIIIGGGVVGLAVAKALEASSDRYRIKIIEKNRQVAEHAAATLDKTVVINGDGLDLDILAEANVSHSDAILAVTDDDRTNLLAVVRGKSEGCDVGIALFNDPSLISLMTPLKIDAHLNPRATTVSSILRHVRHGRVRQVYSVGDAEAEVIEAQILSTSPISGKLIKDIELSAGVMIGVVKRGVNFIKPSGSTKILDGDVVVIFSLSKYVPEVEKLLQVSIDFF
ncbi:MAG: Trk system potassium transporter TrkA [Proteobacteria bacterium]|nr:Trk system potassium transporter TrkA [Pseudomonadota bacterium]